MNDAILKHTAEIIAAHVSHNRIEAALLPDLIQSVFKTLNQIEQPRSAEPVVLTPAVPIKKSVFDDYIVCLEDGKKLKMLKRHLQTAHGMTPDQYRKKWSLLPSYPMVAPSYAARRSSLAKKIGLGRRKKAAPIPEPIVEVKKRRKAA